MSIDLHDAGYEGLTLKSGRFDEAPFTANVVVDALKLNTSAAYQTNQFERRFTYQEVKGELDLVYEKEMGFNRGYYGAFMDEAEDPTKDSLYGKWFDVYMRHRVKNFTGMSFSEFLQLPRWKIQIIIQRLKPINEEESRIAKEAQDEMNRAPKK